MSQEIERQKEEIISLLGNFPEGVSRGQISEKLPFLINDKTLQRRLAALIADDKVTRTGEKKGTRYYSLPTRKETDGGHLKDITTTVFSPQSRRILEFLNTPLYAREKVSYNRNFLDAYAPNRSQYVPDKIREALFHQGKRFDQQLAAGTYAQQICQRLLIDLSYNSSRLEGNTYSHLDTQRLVEEGISAEGKVHEETVMIMNHKEAILFLVENAQDMVLGSLAIRNLHHLLSQDLLANPQACGNIRTLEVNIGQSAYKPLGNPHVLRELFELVLQKARKIKNPFEQSFFLLVHLSYLQAFEDVNKRTSRLSCNIPFIKNNLCPLSFADVSKDDYTAALLAIYEKNDAQPMRELFAWAYSRSCKQYGLVRNSLGEIDAFRVQYRQQRKAIMGQIVRKDVHGSAAEKLIDEYCQDQGISDIDRFTAMTLADLSTLHTGAIIGLGITEAQLDMWLLSRP